MPIAFSNESLIKLKKSILNYIILKIIFILIYL